MGTEELEKGEVESSSRNEIRRISTNAPAVNGDVHQTQYSPKEIREVSTFTERLQMKLSHLAGKDASQLREILLSFEDVFVSQDPSKLPCTPLVQHHIETGNAPPVAKKPYRVPHAQREVLENLIQEQLKAGVIIPSQSPWSAPVVLVPKKSLEPNTPIQYRCCIDFRGLNRVTKVDFYPLPNINETLDYLGNAKVFTTLDLASGYHQIALHPDSRAKTAFSTPNGHYEYTRMPFGLVNAPATFCRLMSRVLSGLQGDQCLVYLDDIIVFGPNHDIHNKRLVQILERIREAHLGIKLEKCHFAQKQVIYLGHLLSENGLEPDPSKVSAVSKFPTPTNRKEIQSFLGLAGYYRRFIPQFSKIAKPLTSLLKKETPFVWSEQCSQSVNELKAALISQPVLIFPDFSQPFILATDASNYAMGAVLSQKLNGHEHPVAYASRQLKPAETRYSTTEKELCAIVWAIKHFRCYLYGRKFTIITDHAALKWLFNLKDPNGRLARWALHLSDYQFDIQHKPGKDHKNADALSRIVGMMIRSDAHQGDVIPYIDRIWIKQFQEAEDMDESSGLVKHEDGLYYHSSTSGEKLYAPKAIRARIMELCHDTPYAGHPGITKTQYRVASDFWWKTLRQDVEDYVKSCSTCERRKIGRYTKTPLMPIPTPGSPWILVSMDIVGPLPLTADGNRFILSVIDHFTRYVIMVALPEQSATTTARAFLQRCVALHGVPAKLLTDQGRNFTSGLMTSLCSYLGTRKLQTTPYHASGNGRVERVHRTIIDSLSHFVNKHHDDWDQWLPLAVMAYNAQIHESTGFSPYELMHGRRMRLPSEDELTPLPEPLLPVQFLEQLRRTHELNVTQATEADAAAKLRQKTQYDKHLNPVPIKKGDKVYAKIHVTNTPTRKLAPRWQGPYLVLKVINGKVVKIQTPQGERTISIDHVKPSRSNSLGETELRSSSDETSGGSEFEDDEQSQPNTSDQAISNNATHTYNLRKRKN